MTHKHRIYLVDVFTDQAYSGNPLAVIASCKPLPAKTMQQIAAEMNFSETTFVTTTKDTDDGYALRVFTPVREIAFTGHPILGTAWVVRHFLSSSASARIYLNLGLGQIPVDFELDANGNELCWFVAPPMTLGAVIDPQEMASVLGLEADEIDSRTPVQVVGAGTAAIIVPLRNRDALQRARLDLSRFAPLAAAGHPPLTYLYCRETRDDRNDITARFFFEAGDVREDPATGNGAAFLGAYLLHHDDPDSGELHLRIEQGEQLQRSSLIHLQANSKQLRVGGSVVATVTGELLSTNSVPESR
jgi:trans-2,3-dihydro-3-hydroxyanthranilate isomerase